jgi:hypothetical protein
LYCELGELVSGDGVHIGVFPSPQENDERHQNGIGRALAQYDPHQESQ